MKAKWGALVVDGRGKIGGHVLSKNKSGAYMRTKVTPVNPQTTAQSLVRSRFTTYAQAWRGLSAAQRAAWRGAVDGFKKTNVFGDMVAPSGFNLYCTLNNNLVTIGQSAINTPPDPSAVDDIVIGALTATDAPALSLAYTAGTGGSTLKVFATPAVSAGKEYVKNLYRLISSDIAVETASPYDAAADYAAVFGAVAAVGSQIFIKTVAVNETTGQEGTPQVTSAVIAAS